MFYSAHTLSSALSTSFKRTLQVQAKLKTVTRLALAGEYKKTSYLTDY